MPFVQITYELPLGIAKGLATGELSMLGTAAVRDSTAITAHIREVSRTFSDSEPLTARAAKSVRDPKILIGLGIVVAAAVGGGLLGGRVLRRRRQTGEPAVRQSVQAYNSALSAYLQAISTGSLDAALLSELESSLKVLESESGNGKFSIKVSDDEARTLVDVVRDYTRQLAVANGFHNLEAELSAAKVSDPVVDLRRYLELQRRILTEAA